MTQRFLILSLLLLASFAAFAQSSADLTAAIIADPVADAARGFSWQIDVINNGPGIAHGVVVTAWSEPALNTSCDTQTIAIIYPDSHQLVQCFTGALGTPGDVVIHAHVGYDPDPNPQNDDATTTIHEEESNTDIGLVVFLPTIDPGLPFTITGSVYNRGVSPATGVKLTLTIPTAFHVTSLPANCTQSGQLLTCGLRDVPGNAPYTGQKDFSITLTADDSTNGQAFPISADVRTTAPEIDLRDNHVEGTARVFRTFYVTQTAGDALSAAIEQANLGCTDEYPCKVAFRLGTPPASGYFTFRPVNALPKIRGKNISIDGTTQTRLTGDTNPNGPEIYIDGSNSTWEDAIAVDELCGMEIAGLAIGNFKNAAVTVGGELGIGADLPCNSYLFTRTVHDNYLGVDPTGTQPAPNGRGVVINDHLYLSVGTQVTNNVISANQRSGVWIGRSFGESVSGNRIGLDIHNQPLGNGASGIYVGPTSFQIDIRGNYVAFNHDFGIAVDHGAIGTNIGPNSIFANMQLGIDVGLDGPTPDRGTPAPTILSAQYDPATNTTVLTIASSEPPNVVLPTLIMYASDAPHPSGYGDGQYYLGSLRFNSQQGNIRFAAIGDWRGKWVSATVTRNNFYGFLRTNATQPNAEFPDTTSTTSEFSRAVKVE